MKLKLPAREDAAVDMAPMIDLVFLLLIFFMVASVVTELEKVEVAIPESEYAKVPEDTKNRMMLSIDANNIVRYLSTPDNSHSGVNTTSPPTKQNVKNAGKVDKLTENLVKTCNKILVKREKDCQCYDDNGIAATDYFECDKQRNTTKNKPSKMARI